MAPSVGEAGTSGDTFNDLTDCFDSSFLTSSLDNCSLVGITAVDDTADTTDTDEPASIISIFLSSLAESLLAL